MIEGTILAAVKTNFTEVICVLRHRKYQVTHSKYL